jgi:hypothetical protein
MNLHLYAGINIVCINLIISAIPLLVFLVVLREKQLQTGTKPDPF